MSPKCLHRIFWAIEKDEKAFSGVSTERNYHGRTQIAKLKSLMRITGLRRVFQKNFTLWLAYRGKGLARSAPSVERALGSQQFINSHAMILERPILVPLLVR
jgi:hypothetical protein